MDKPTLQKILDEHKAEVFKTLSFPCFQRKALEKLSVCRTARLGGHVEYCENGHVSGVWYNSCRQRSCPQCQNLAKAQWLDTIQERLLNCPHHHVIFTLPHELNNLWRHNRALMADLLFQSALKTLKTFSQNPNYLGAQAGMLAALHTWGRNLSLHPHLHVLISHGGLAANGAWVEPKKAILFPQKPVMQVFRGKFCAAIQAALKQGALQLPADARENTLLSLLNKLGRSPWVVHFCNQYVHGKGVAKYLARYVKGGAFNNQQIKQVQNGQMRFLYKSHKTHNYEHLNLSVNNFLLRVADHIPPKGKSTVRYAGLYSPSCREKLNTARAKLKQEPVPEAKKLDWQVWLQELGCVRCCSVCNGSLVKREAVRVHCA
jgi:Putative transposase/Transposase zinc-binding domain